MAPATKVVDAGRIVRLSYLTIVCIWAFWYITSRLLDQPWLEYSSLLLHDLFLLLSSSIFTKLIPLPRLPRVSPEAIKVVQVLQ